MPPSLVFCFCSLSASTFNVLCIYVCSSSLGRKKWLFDLRLKTDASRLFCIVWSWLLADLPGSSWLVLTLNYEVTRQSTVSWALIGSRFNLSPDSSEKFISGPLTLCCRCFFTHSPLKSGNVIHFVWSLVIVFSVQTTSLLPQLKAIWPFSSDFLTSTSHFHPDNLLLTGSFLFFRKFSVNSRDGCVGKSQQISSFWNTQKLLCSCCWHQRPCHIQIY